MILRVVTGLVTGEPMRADMSHHEPMRTERDSLTS